jgi:hypothetical protein
MLHQHGVNEPMTSCHVCQTARGLKAGAVCLFALLICKSGCSRCETLDDETRIRALIEKAEKSAESHAIGEILDLTTEDLLVQPGDKNRASVKRTLFVAFQFYGKLDVMYPRPTVNVDKSGAFAEALIHFVVVPSGKQRPDLTALYEDPEAFMETASELADLYKLELWLKKEGGDWLVRKARIHGSRSLVPRI